MFSKFNHHPTTLFTSFTQAEMNHVTMPMVSSYAQLLDTEINSPENLAALYSHPKHADKIALALRTLHEYRVLTDVNRLRICAHANCANDIATAIVTLHRSGIDTQPHWLLIAVQPDRAVQIATSFEFLQRNMLLTQRNKSMICSIHAELSSKDATTFVNALSWLFFEGKLNQKNFDKLCASPQDAWLIDGSKPMHSNPSVFSTQV